MTLIIAFILSIQLFYWLYFFYSLSLPQARAFNNQSNQAVSIIICAKNDLTNLKKNLPHFIDHSLNIHELIIADDFSEDGTSAYMKKIDKKKGTLIFYEVKENKQGKKQALAEALAVGRHDWVLLTDTDCRPSTKGWIPSMLAKISTKHIKIVLGYSPTRRNSKFISVWAHFESWFTAVQYLSYAHRGLPYMGVGRNLLYDKRLLDKQTLSAYVELSSGDDDLTIMQIATAQNTAINLDPDSFVFTSSPSSIGDYVRQKRRHYSTASSYKPKFQFLLGLFSLSQMLFYGLLLMLIFKQQYLLSLSIFMTRLLLISPVVQRLRKILKAEFSFFEFLYLDILLAIHYIFFSFAVIRPQKNKW